MFQIIYSLILALALVACTEEESPLPDRDGDGAPDQVDQFPDDINKAFIVLTNVTGLRGQVKLILNDNEILAEGDGSYQFEIPYAEAFNLKAEHLVEDQLCEISQPIHDGRSFIGIIEISCIDRISIDLALTSVSDPNFRECIQSEDPNMIITPINSSSDNFFYKKKEWVDQVTSIWCTNSEIESTEGLEEFYNLQYLKIKLNGFLEINKNLELVELEAESYGMNISGLKKLEKLSISSYGEGKIILSDLDSLKELEVIGTSLNHLDFGRLDKLENIAIISSMIESVDVSKLSNLKLFFSLSVNLKNLDFSNNSELEGLILFYTNIENLNLSENPRISWLMLSYNKLKEIDLSSNGKLMLLDLKENQLRNAPKGIRVIKDREANIDFTGNPLIENTKADLAILKEYYINLIYDEDN